MNSVKGQRTVIGCTRGRPRFKFRICLSEALNLCCKPELERCGRRFDRRGASGFAQESIREADEVSPAGFPHRPGVISPGMVECSGFSCASRALEGIGLSLGLVLEDLNNPLSEVVLRRACCIILLLGIEYCDYRVGCSCSVLIFRTELRHVVRGL
jgi:hypothetical protein